MGPFVLNYYDLLLWEKLLILFNPTGTLKMKIVWNFLK